VHLSTGLKGIAYKRLRAAPLAHEPLFYLEPVSLSRWQLVVKRGLDIAVASVSLLFAAPVLALAAIAIKLDDRGPVFFRQRRVGRAGLIFEVLKLRTMVPDAEQRLGEVTADNQRRDGPLFKVTDDPRRTRVGRVLEATSLDELPQLINVLLGSMSLVGPRPALPDEVAKFDDELLERHSVRPGITGLWQVEARDNPSFEAYRRLDLFYVENWSVTLDLAVLFETFQAVIARLLRGPMPHPDTSYSARDRSTAA
jgi:lipopolysaccharide/colanic/teichoic acid biosynthesis glycosyltransferase